jgi:hypothetical protein
MRLPYERLVQAESSLTQDPPRAHLLRRCLPD